MTLPARRFHLLPVEGLLVEPELGDPLSPDRPIAEELGRLAVPADAEAVAKQGVPRGCLAAAAARETSSKLNSIRHHVLRSRMMFRILSFFPLNGMNGKTNSKGFSVRASELPDAFR